MPLGCLDEHLLLFHSWMVASCTYRESHKIPALQGVKIDEPHGPFQLCDSMIHLPTHDRHVNSGRLPTRALRLRNFLHS